MKVFSDTTPFIALASIDRLDLLPKLSGRFTLPLKSSTSAPLVD